MGDILEHDIADVYYNGFEDDARADQIVARLESALRHSPASCGDWLPDYVNTNASCVASLASDLGYVMRSRPDFDTSAARAYYNLALEADPTHCGSLSYLTELELKENNETAAVSAAKMACAACGMSLDVLSLLQGFSEKGWSLPSRCMPSLPRFIKSRLTSTSLRPREDLGNGSASAARASQEALVGILLSLCMVLFQII